MTQSLPYSKNQIVDRIFAAGVVGAGGAGFPTHIKAKASVDIVIANGCECEPLIQSDKYVLGAHPDEVTEGLLAMMLATGAGRGILAIREGLGEVETDLRKHVQRIAGVEVITIPNNYPAGDEHILVYEVTGRVIPQGGIPPDVGALVCNVNTLTNVKRALQNIPVTTRVLSLCGDVPNPCIVEVPVGATVMDVLHLTGNSSSLESKGVLVSGVMMGILCDDLLTPLDKRIGSVVALPRDSELIVRKSLPVEIIVRRAASVCCQCTFCTELCPRHLMGHAIVPHRIMRAIAWSRTFLPDLTGALFCSGCGLCGAYVCPMLLSPDRISFMVRSEMTVRGVKFEQQPASWVEPLRPHRLVPHRRIVERIGLASYEREIPFGGKLEPERVSIPLSQHSGVAAKAVVRTGDRVTAGQVVGDVDPTTVGARVHASIDGVVVSVNHEVVVEKR